MDDEDSYIKISVKESLDKIDKKIDKLDSKFDDFKDESNKKDERLGKKVQSHDVSIKWIKGYIVLIVSAITIGAASTFIFP